jgi:hypothetical protein
VLITSQNAIWPPGQAMEVPVLGTEVAARFLVQQTGDSDGQADAAVLAAELDGLPLALEQAAAYIQAAGITLAGYRYVPGPAGGFAGPWRERATRRTSPPPWAGVARLSGGGCRSGCCGASVPGARAGTAGPAARGCQGRW